MKRKVISTTEGASTVPLSAAIKVGQLVFTSGQVGVNRETGTVPGDTAGQTRQCLENLRQVLEAAGLDFESVVKAQVYLTDMNDFQQMNGMYREYFPTEPPARTTVGVAALARPDFKVEVDLVALIPE